MSDVRIGRTLVNGNHFITENKHIYIQQCPNNEMNSMKLVACSYSDVLPLSETQFRDM